MTDDNRTPLVARSGSGALSLQRRDLLMLLVCTLLLLLGLWLMNLWIFPHGTGLGGDADLTVERGQDDNRGQRDFSVLGAGDDGEQVAYLSAVERTVKLRAANTVAWAGADAGAALRNQDAVQTSARSRAVIAFSQSSTLELGESSLIVIQSGVRDAFVPRRRVALRLENGELAGTHVAAADDLPLADDLDLELPFGRLRVFGGDAARFKVRTNPDDTSTVEILSGGAELEAAGQLVRIGANQGVTFGADSVDLKVRELPAAPRALGPAQASVLRYADVPPRVRFRWRGSGEQQYRFVLARDRAFTDVLADTRIGRSNIDFDTLEGGEYFWTVRALRDWQESPPTPVQRVVLEHDQQPPALTAAAGADVAQGGQVVVRGRTEPGARVLVDGEAVSTSPDGRFVHRLRLQPGVSLVVVEAIDEVGNMAFSSVVVRTLTTLSAGDLP